MKFENLTVKTILAVFIVFFGMIALVFIQMPDTLQNSIINIMIMVVSYHFGSSAGSAAKDKLIQETTSTIESIGGSNPPPKKDEK